MRIVRRLAVMLAVLAAVLFLMPAQGNASPWVPGTDCNEPPTPQMPNSGLSGFIDSGSTNPDTTATDPYSTVEYPPNFHTYDLGSAKTLCATPIDDMDNQLANWIKGVATSIVAACNALHRLVSPPKFLTVFDPLLTQATAAVQKSIYTEYLGLALLIVGLWLLWKSRERKFAEAVSTVTWMLLIMGVATFLFSYPVKAGHAADDVVTTVSGNIDASVGGKPNVDPASASAIVLTDNVLYRPWLMGELGSADSSVAKKYGMRLLDDQTYSYAEAKQINADPDAAAKLTRDKKADFQKVAKLIKKEDPGAYEHLQGGDDRIGAAVISLVSAVSTAPFMIMADFLRVVALLIWRLGIIFAPAVAVIAIIPKFRKVGMVALSAVSAALVNAVVFALGSAINFLAVRVLLDPSVQLPEWARILLCLAVSIILWKAFKPARKLTTMVSAASISKGAQGGLGLGKAAKKLGGFAVGAASAVAGILAADEIERKLHPEPSERTEAFTRPAQEYRWSDTSATSGRTQSAPAGLTSKPRVEPTLSDSTDMDVSDVQRGPNFGATTVRQPNVYAPAGNRPAIGGGQRQIAPEGAVYEPEPEYVPPAARAEPKPPMMDLRGDQVMVDGVPSYRIWSSDTKSYEDVNEGARPSSAYWEAMEERMS